MTGHRTWQIDVHDMVHELVDTHIHREHYQVRRGSIWVGFDHQTRVPSLIHQLEHSSPSGSGAERGNSGFGSRPAARLEALDCLIRIDHQAARWLRALGEDDDDGTERVIRRVYALTRAALDVRSAADRDIRRWWAQARVAAGWDSPAWRPASTCPLCGNRGSLRIKLLDGTAFCVECTETWTPETIALLAEHIRAENREDQVS